MVPSQGQSDRPPGRSALLQCSSLVWGNREVKIAVYCANGKWQIAM